MLSLSVCFERAYGHSVLSCCCLLRQGFQNGIHFLSYSCQSKLKLVLRTDQPWSLVSNVLQCRCNVNLLHSFSHAVQHHVDQDVCASPSSAIIAVNDDGTGSSSVAFIYLPAEVQKWSGGGWDTISWPAQQMKLCQGSRLLSLDILQVEATHQEVLTPDVL